MKLFIKHFKKKLFNLLPQKIRYKLIRSGINIEYKLNPKLSFKIAKSKEELKSAFELLHEAYVRSGYMKPHPSKMRLTIYHALPETTTLIAVMGKKVVATVSIIKRTKLGLPGEKIFKISHLIKGSCPCAEVSALAIHKDYQKRGGEILFPLLKYTVEYSLNYFGIKLFFITVNPKGIDYYKALLSFKSISSDKIANYSYVNNAPAVGAFLYLDDLYRKMYINFRGKPDNRNLFKYFFEFKHPYFILPERKYYSTFDPVMSPALLKFFFKDKSNIFKLLTEHELKLFQNIYKNDQYKDLLPDIKNSPISYNKRTIEFPVSCPGIILMENRDNIKMHIANVSKKRLTAFLSEKLIIADKVHAKIEIADFEIINLTLNVIFCDLSDLYYKFEIIKSDEKWIDFINYSEKKLLLMKTAVFNLYKRKK